LGGAIGDALLIDVEAAFAIGIEEQGFAIGRPSTRPIEVFIQGQSLRGVQFVPAVSQFAEICSTLQPVIKKDEVFPVCGHAKALKRETRPCGELARISLGLAAFYVVTQIPLASAIRFAFGLCIVNSWAVR